MAGCELLELTSEINKTVDVESAIERSMILLSYPHLDVRIVSYIERFLNVASLTELEEV